MPLQFIAVILVISSMQCLLGYRNTINNIRTISPPKFASISDIDLYDMGYHVYCNVELNGENVQSVGFDMDHTLAQYTQAFDILIFDDVKRRLHKLGYPSAVLDFEYTPGSFRRGIIIDKARGNFLKIDRHKYVRQVYHGFEEVSSEERKELYSRNVHSYTESNYVNLDSLYLIVDAVLFANLINLKDKVPGAIRKTYEEIFRDLRRCIEECNADTSIKDQVVAGIEKYVRRDSGIFPTLKRIRSAGKKIFLLTNSMWEYTDSVMRYLIDGSEDWTMLFDIIIVGASKPAFWTDDYLTLFRVESKAVASKDGMQTVGSLYNIEDKFSVSLATIKAQSYANGKMANVFQGGNWQDLHRLLAVSAGDRVLYVGDDMYADILRSKRSLGWRTCLVVPELEEELNIALENQNLGKNVLRMRQLQYDLDEYLDLLRVRYRQTKDPELNDKLIEGAKKADELKTLVRALVNEYNAKFNERWGQIFKAGHKDSRFAKQVTDYACLYTSRVSNLGLVSPNRFFRPIQDYMPHDQVAIDIELLNAASKGYNNNNDNP